MTKFREPKEDDQAQIDMCFNMIKSTAISNPEIEGAIWVSVCFSLIAESFKENGLSYEDYCEEMNNAMRHYKSWFDEEKDPKCDVMEN